MKYNIKSFFSIAVFSVVITCVFCFMTGCSNKSDIDTLTKIDSYQEQYFKIIKRNDIFLRIESCDECDRDSKELSKLYDVVENQIHNNYYLQQYIQIEQKFAYNPGETTVEMNEFEDKHYEAVDKLLNETYQAVKKEISEEEFKKLTLSELKWLKEVKNYRKVFEEQQFGTIGSQIFTRYQINMRDFRTLLLMLYLPQNNDITDEKLYNVISISSTQLENKSTKQLLNMLIEQDYGFNYIISKIKPQRTDNVFETFYENLQKIISKISIDDLNVTYEEDGTPIMSPSTEIITFNDGIKINDNYLNKKYSKYLGNAWKEYLNLSSESKMHDINSGMSTNPLELVDEIVAWQAFLNNNPNFILANKIKKNIKTETLEIMYHNYIFAYTEDGSMSKDGRKGYEKFLKKVNQNTEEYNAVKKCYDELQSHGFQGTKEFYRLLYEYGQDSWYKELYDEVLVAN